jgi:polar amino acid transport system substrate-binding protein
MKDTAAIVMVIIVVFLAASGCVSAPADQPRTAITPVPQEGKPQYVIGVDSDYPPFTYRDAAGNLTGFDIDAARWIAEREGFDVEFVAVPWDRIMPALKDGTIDMVYSGMTVTPEREKDARFTTSYYTVNLSVAIRQGSGVALQDLYAGRLRIGTQDGSTGAAWVEEKLVKSGKMPAANHIRFPDLSALVENLANKTIDASVYDAPPQEWAITGKSLTIIGEIPTQERYAVAIRKNDTHLLATMDDGLRQIMADPYWQHLLRKYDLATGSGSS